MDLEIKGKTAVITGGDSGMGLATAKLLASEGVNIILSDQTHDELEKAAEEVRQYAKEVSTVAAFTADVTKNEEVLQLAAQAKERFGGAHILVHCAGIRGAAGDFLSLTNKDWYKSIDVDLMGAVRACLGNLYRFYYFRTHFGFSQTKRNLVFPVVFKIYVYLKTYLFITAYYYEVKLLESRYMILL